MLHYSFHSGFVILFILFQTPLPGQLIPSEIRSHLEDLADPESGISDPSEILEELVHLTRLPLDVNKDDLDVLIEFGLLRQSQYAQLRNHQANSGPLLSIYELQSIPEWDVALIRLLQPFIKVGKQLDDLSQPIDKLTSGGQHEITTYFRKTLEPVNGFISQDSGGIKEYAAFGFRSYLKYRYRYHQKISAGLLLEQDPGEELFSGSNRLADFSSCHIYFRDISRSIRSVLAGDYRLSLGQGLIIHSAYAGGKSPAAVNLKKGGRVFRPHTSASESGFLRGFAAEFAFTPGFRGSFFFSYKGMDGNLSSDTLNNGTQLADSFITTLYQSGLHRTKREISNEKAVQLLNYGGKLSQRGRNYSIALNYMLSKFSIPLRPTESIADQYRFDGHSLQNTSIDYSVRIANLQFFGEAAMSDNGSGAILSGLLFGLGKNLSFSLLYRNYGRRYQSLFANAIGDASNTSNEQALYTGLALQINKSWTLSAYADSWKHPWLKYSLPFPTHGQDFSIRISYLRKRNINAYLQFRMEQEEKANTGSGYAVQIRSARTRLRLHLNYHISKSLEWRSRFEWLSLEEEASSTLFGYLLYQDLIFRPIGFPLSFSGRIALFDTQSSSARIYSYENNVLYNGGIPSYAGKGQRFYINLRYKPSASLTLETRYANVYYANLSNVGSGTDKIEGNQKSEIAFQCRFTF